MSKNINIKKIFCVLSSCAILSFAEVNVLAMKPVSDNNFIKLKDVSADKKEKIIIAIKNTRNFLDLYNDFVDNKAFMLVDIYDRKYCVGKLPGLSYHERLNALVDFSLEIINGNVKVDYRLEKTLVRYKSTLKALIDRYENGINFEGITNFLLFFDCLCEETGIFT